MTEPQWTPEEIEARRHDPMPDLPVLPGIAEVDQPAVQALAAPVPLLGTIAAMVAAAYALVGIHEKPMGSNYAPPVTTWYGAGNVSWCDEAISYEAAHSGNAAAIGGKWAYCPAHTRWFLAHGKWKYGAGDLRIGDVVFYNWSRGATLDADHVGLVVHVYSDGSFLAAEGNHNDQFIVVHRDGTYVAGRGRPAYAATPTPPPPATAEDSEILHEWVF